MRRPLALESQRIATCVVAYVAAHPSEAPALFELVAALIPDPPIDSAVDFAFLLDACRTEFPASFSASQKALVQPTH